jgi:hypothetical protein
MYTRLDCLMRLLLFPRCFHHISTSFCYGDDRCHCVAAGDLWKDARIGDSEVTESMNTKRLINDT